MTRNVSFRHIGDATHWAIKGGTTSGQILG